MTRIYLDHAATTPILPQAEAAAVAAMRAWANPSSPHADGRATRAILEQARRDIADVLGWTGEVIFTSGASESIEIAGRRTLISGRAHSATEHPIVPFAMGEDSQVIPVGRDGLIDEGALDQILDKGPTLVAIQQVNNETGVIQPLDRLAARIREAGSLLLADCAQSASKMPLPNADFVAICAHKLGGPPGIGALLVRDIATFAPSGGGQEKGYRRGTQDVPAAAAFAAALTARPYDMARLAALRAELERRLADLGAEIIAANSQRLPTIGAVALRGTTNMAMLVQFDLAGIAVSAGSACSSGKAKASEVLAAMHIDPDLQSAFLRVSFGPHTSDADIDRLVDEFARIASRHRQAA